MLDLEDLNRKREHLDAQKQHLDNYLQTALGPLARYPFWIRIQFWNPKTACVAISVISLVPLGMAVVAIASLFQDVAVTMALELWGGSLIEIGLVAVFAGLFLLPILLDTLRVRVHICGGGGSIYLHSDDAECLLLSDLLTRYPYLTPDKLVKAVLKEINRSLAREEAQILPVARETEQEILIEEELQELKERLHV